MFLVWFRDVLLFKATKEMDSLVFKDEYNFIKERADKSSYESLENIIILSFIICLSDSCTNSVAALDTQFLHVLEVVDGCSDFVLNGVNLNGSRIRVIYFLLHNVLLR